MKIKLTKTLLRKSLPWARLYPGALCIYTVHMAAAAGESWSWPAWGFCWGGGEGKQEEEEASSGNVAVRGCRSPPGTGGRPDLARPCWKSGRSSRGKGEGGEGCDAKGGRRLEVM